MLVRADQRCGEQDDRTDHEQVKSCHQEGNIPAGVFLEPVQEENRESEQ
jgi:hypothetical protein